MNEKSNLISLAYSMSERDRKQAGGDLGLRFVPYKWSYPEGGVCPTIEMDARHPWGREFDHHQRRYIFCEFAHIRYEDNPWYQHGCRARLLADQTYEALRDQFITTVDQRLGLALPYVRVNEGLAPATGAARAEAMAAALNRLNEEIAGTQGYGAERAQLRESLSLGVFFRRR